MTTMFNNPGENQNILNLFEPAPVLNVTERTNLDVDLNENYVALGCSTDVINVQSTVNSVFCELSLRDVTAHFEPSTCMWLCSYFPDGFIAPVSFTIRLWNQAEQLLIEPSHLSGHFITYTELQQNVLESVYNYINIGSVAQ